MVNEWRVLGVPVKLGEMRYTCYRLKDITAADKRDNCERLGRWFGTKEAAQVVADQMNKGELA